MALIVQKFGGTSVKDSERLKEVARWIIKTKELGNQVIVVVSAPGGMTDSLIKRAKEINTTPSGRELDSLLSVGEQISASLLAMTINQMGHKAISFTGAQLNIKTTGEFNNAKILEISSQKITENIDRGSIVIVTGFQGVNEQGYTTTLGRGGSDTTAVAIGAALSADQVEIYTDVDGIYTADPRVVKSARKIPEISFDEVIEMAGKGAKVLHCRSVEIAAKYNIDIHLRSSFTWEEGSWIRRNENMEKALVRGITHIKDLAKLTVCQLGDNSCLQRVMGAIEDNNLDIKLVNQGIDAEGKFELSFILEEREAIRISELLKDRLKGNGRVGINLSLGMVSAVGIGIRSNRLQGSIMKLLNDRSIRSEMISSSETSLSFVVPLKDVNSLKQAMHHELIEKTLLA